MAYEANTDVSWSVNLSHLFLSRKKKKTNPKAEQACILHA